MSMKTLREYIREAEDKKVAIGHFNFSNLEGFHAIFEAARELDLPIILGTSEGERDFVGLEEAVALVRAMREKYNYPIFLNADHTYTFEGVKAAVDAGYDMVIFDGVKLSYEENVEMTKKCVEYARSVNPDIVIEAELGNIGQSSKVLEEIPEGVATSEEFLTSPEDAKQFVEETGIDVLAPAVGNLHGMLKTGRNPEINADRIAQIREAAGVPLVLHGGSGISDEDFVKAIDAGISVIHINTQIRVAFREALEKTLAEKPDEVAPYRLLKPSLESMKEIVASRLKLFNKM